MTVQLWLGKGQGQGSVSDGADLLSRQGDPLLVPHIQRGQLPVRTPSLDPACLGRDQALRAGLVWGSKHLAYSSVRPNDSLVLFAPITSK